MKPKYSVILFDSPVYISPQCHHANVLYLKIIPPGDTTAAYAGGIDEQVCAETTLPAMTITTVVPDS